MGRRKRVKANGKYGAREMRAPTKDHPDPDAIRFESGSLPPTLNPNQPLTTPDVLDRGQFGVDTLVPIDLRWERGRWYPPTLIQDLRWELATLRRRLHEEILYLAIGSHRAEEWIKVHAPQVSVKVPWSPIVRGSQFMSSCRQSLHNRLPSIGKYQNNLHRDDVTEYIEEKLRIISLVEENVEYCKILYKNYAKIANNNFRGGRSERKKVSLGRLIQALECLPRRVSDDELLDVAFHGAVDPSLIHQDRYAMSDLLVLAAALGHLRYGRFYPTKEIAQTYLFVVGQTQDASLEHNEIALARRRMADLLIERYGLADLQFELTEICNAVVRGEKIPPHLHRLQFDIIP